MKTKIEKNVYDPTSHWFKVLSKLKVGQSFTFKNSAFDNIRREIQKVKKKFAKRKFKTKQDTVNRRRLWRLE